MLITDQDVFARLAACTQSTYWCNGGSAYIKCCAAGERGIVEWRDRAGLDLTAVSGCSVYKKVASLAANQEGLPEPSARSAAPSMASAHSQAERASSSAQPSGTQEQSAQPSAELAASGSSTEGIVMQSEGTRAAQQESKPLGRSLFQGAMRRLAGTQSEGAPDVQVIRACLARCWHVLLLLSDILARMMSAQRKLLQDTFLHVS